MAPGYQQEGTFGVVMHKRWPDPFRPSVRRIVVLLPGLVNKRYREKWRLNRAKAGEETHKNGLKQTPLGRRGDDL
jgi:hypothetical protein